MAQAILGPVLSDLLTLADGAKFTLATAFYSAARLDATTISAQAADVLVRLDLTSADDWVNRSIAPDALLRFWKRHTKTEIRLYHTPTAHAKIYAGDNAFLIGSANFTVRGLSGSADEILWRESSSSARKEVAKALDEYKAGMQQLTYTELEAYVAKYLPIVAKRQKTARRSREGSLPDHGRRAPRVGSYDDFLKWLDSDGSDAADEIQQRAGGKGNLSGHIRTNFYGIREFLLAYPRRAEKLYVMDPDLYKLRSDAVTEAEIRQFVSAEATDEGGLSISTWRTYLPETSGGKPKTGGGTLGNLNRMLPLMARYLASRA